MSYQFYLKGQNLYLIRDRKVKLMLKYLGQLVRKKQLGGLTAHRMYGSHERHKKGAIY